MTYEEIRERADRVRGLPLEAVLLLAGAERDRYDTARWHTGHGVLSVTGPKFMNWHHGTGGGGAIDLVIHLKGLGFKDAVQWLCDRFPGLGGPRAAVPPRSPARLALPPLDVGKLPHVTQYLVRERRLAPALIEPLIASGRIYADRRGNAIFLLLGKETRPVGAELRGTTSARWRGMAPGSRKDLGYFSIGASQATTVVLCESAIDAMSCFAINPDRLCISTSGARPNPRWLAAFIERGHEVYCGFDADPTGDAVARDMIALYPAVQRLRPALHDWNDVLRASK